MNSFMQFMEEKFVPIAAKIGGQRHLVAIRDAFVAILPIILAGSFAVLVNNMGVNNTEELGLYQSFMLNIFGDNWKSFGGNIWWGTFAIMSLFIAFTFPYNLAKSYDLNALGVATLSFASYFVLVPQISPASGGWGDINWSFTNATALFVALIVGLLVTELYRLLSKSSALTIKMPDAVPPAVSKAFAALIPSVIILSLFSFAQIFIFADRSLFSIVTELIAEPFSRLGNTMPAAILIAVFNHLFWFFGLHGSQILEPLMQAVYVPATIANDMAVSAGLEPIHIVTKAFFDAFVYMGGSGATIALIGAIFLVSNTKHYRMLAGMAAPSGAFNINEPMIFGMPIVVNPVFFIPFILAPVLMTINAYFVTAIGLVPMTTVNIPWVTPPILGGFLATGGSVAGAILSAVNLVIAFLVYIPFVFIADGVEKKKELERAKA